MNRENDDGGRPWNRTRHGSPRRSYSPLPHLAARRPKIGGYLIDYSNEVFQGIQQKKIVFLRKTGLAEEVAVD